MSRKLLIIGGTGIIGQYLAEAAVEVGIEVYVLSRGSQLENPSGRIKQITGDARDFEVLKFVANSLRFEYVVDLLSFDPEQLSKTREAFQGKCEQFVFVSSATIFGGGSYNARITERSDYVNSSWQYPKKKIDSELFLRNVKFKTASPFYTIVRPYITYSEKRVAFGIWEDGDLMARLVQGAPIVIGNELAQTQTTLTHSRDLARGIVALLGNEKAKNNDFNVVSDETFDWQGIYKIASDWSRKTPNIVKAPVSSVVRHFPELRGKAEDRSIPRVFDTSRFRDACPGFVFEHNLAEGYHQVLTVISEGQLPSSGPGAAGRMHRLVESALRELGESGHRERDFNNHDRRNDRREDSLRRWIGATPGVRSTIKKLQSLQQNLADYA